MKLHLQITRYESIQAFIFILIQGKNPINNRQLKLAAVVLLCFMSIGFHHEFIIPAYSLNHHCDMVKDICVTLPKNWVCSQIVSDVFTLHLAVLTVLIFPHNTGKGRNSQLEIGKLTQNTFKRKNGKRRGPRPSKGPWVLPGGGAVRIVRTRFRASLQTWKPLLSLKVCHLESLCTNGFRAQAYNFSKKNDTVGVEITLMNTPQRLFAQFSPIHWGLMEVRS